MSEQSDDKRTTVIEGEDYYIEDGLMVLTATYLCKRGHCCGSGCRHCPYSDEERVAAVLKKKFL